MLNNIKAVSDGQVIRRRLSLARYSEDLEGDYVRVWLNPDQDFYDQWDAFRVASANVKALTERDEPKQQAERDALAQEIREAVDEMTDLSIKCHSKLWGIGYEDAQMIYETAPGLYQWMNEQAWEMIHKHGARRRKK
jgi:hypothetical protein